MPIPKPRAKADKPSTPVLNSIAECDLCTHEQPKRFQRILRTGKTSDCGKPGTRAQADIARLVHHMAACDHRGHVLLFWSARANRKQIRDVRRACSDSPGQRVLAADLERLPKPISKKTDRSADAALRSDAHL